MQRSKAAAPCSSGTLIENDHCFHVAFRSALFYGGAYDGRSTKPAEQATAMDTNRPAQSSRGSSINLREYSAPESVLSPIVTTLVWMDEYERLDQIYHDADNHSPTFRTPDLISASITVVFDDVDPADRIFRHVHTIMLLRDLDTPRHAAAIWRAQYELLLALQRSPRNRHPNPRFNLDHFTTACVHLALEQPEAKHRILAHARQNTARRALAIA